MAFPTLTLACGPCTAATQQFHVSRASSTSVCRRVCAIDFYYLFPSLAYKTRRKLKIKHDDTSGRKCWPQTVRSQPGSAWRRGECHVVFVGLLDCS